jgi:hypothetical protein
MPRPEPPAFAKVLRANPAFRGGQSTASTPTATIGLVPMGRSLTSYRSLRVPPASTGLAPVERSLASYPRRGRGPQPPSDRPTGTSPVVAKTRRVRGWGSRSVMGPTGTSPVVAFHDDQHLPRRPGGPPHERARPGRRPGHLELQSPPPAPRRPAAGQGASPRRANTGGLGDKL